MKSPRTSLIATVGALGLSVGIAGTAMANPSPNGPGQPGAPNTTCQKYLVTPGNSMSAGGSVFNPTGTAGTVYAGNVSRSPTQSPKAVSQYDIACFQATAHAGP
jgi:hypothetical protein